MKSFSSLLATSLVVAACNPAPAEPTPNKSAADVPAAKAAEAAALPEPDPKLLAPEKANEQAPATYKVKFKTTKGEFTVEAHRDWSPSGADRFYNLVKIGFFTDVMFFRAVEGFMVQFGIHGHPKVSAAWRNANIQDEPVKEGNKRARMSFAKAGPNTRSTQFFINYADNSRLDKMGFPAFAEVVSGMDVLDALNKEYAEEPSQHQDKIQRLGNPWLVENYPKLDAIKSAEIVP